MKVQNSVYFNSHFIWSDNWVVEDNKIWFMGGGTNYLFCIERSTKEITSVAAIPGDSINGFREHPRCIKNGNRIFCLPDIGENIWCYDLSCGSWEMIPVKNEGKVRMSCHAVGFVQDKLYMVSLGLRKILELDIHTQEVNYYEICIDTEQKVAGSILKDECIYVACSCPAAIYKFACLTKKGKMYPLPQIYDQLQTLCFDGKKFWMSGRKKKIYIWEEDTNSSMVLDGFPEGFGIYNFSGKYKDVLNYEVEEAHVPMFQASVPVGRHVWFIPFQTNEILYVDKDDFSINVFPIENEMHDIGNVATQFLAGKYLLEYLWDERYIGLYSLKNKWMLEIDGKKLLYRVMDYEMDDLKTVLKMLMLEEKNRKPVKYEGSCIGERIYLALKNMG